MDLKIISLTALIILFTVSQISDNVFNIKNDVFYRPFHFLAGFFTTLLFFNLTNSLPLSFISTFFAGIIWEIYEWSLWKYIPRYHKRTNKPKESDTKTDLFDDMSGAALGVISILIFVKLHVF